MLMPEADGVMRAELLKKQQCIGRANISTIADIES